MDRRFRMGKKLYELARQRQRAELAMKAFMTSLKAAHKEIDSDTAFPVNRNTGEITDPKTKEVVLTLSEEELAALNDIPDPSVFSAFIQEMPDD